MYLLLRRSGQRLSSSFLLRRTPSRRSLDPMKFEELLQKFQQNGREAPFLTVATALIVGASVGYLGGVGYRWGFPSESTRSVLPVLALCYSGGASLNFATVFRPFLTSGLRIALPVSVPLGCVIGLDYSSDFFRKGGGAASSTEKK